MTSCRYTRSSSTDLSVDIELSDSGDRYWWVEEIDDPELAQKIKKLSHEEIELITLYAFENYTQVEIAEFFKVSNVAIFKRIEKLKKYFRKFC